jgi:hypothetical protein
MKINRLLATHQDASGPLAIRGVRAQGAASQRWVPSLRGTRSALYEIRPSLFSEISKESRGLSMLFV